MKKTYGAILLVSIFIFLTKVAGNTSDLARGRMALEDGFYSSALETFNRILVDDTTDNATKAEAADGILRSYAVQKDFDQLSVFLRSAGVQNYLRPVDLAYWRSFVLERMGNWDGALAELSSLSEEESRRSIRILQLKASLFLQLEKFDQAIDLFEYLATETKSKQFAAQSRLDWGRALHRAAKYAEAVRIWEPLLVATNQHPQLSARARYLMGETYIQQQEYDAAEEVLSPLLENLADGDMLSTSALLSVAKVKKSRGDFQAAVALLQDGITSLENVALVRRLHIELGRALLQSGALDEGRKEILAFMSSNMDSPEAPDLLLELGKALIETSRYDDANAIYQRYLEAFGDHNGVASYGRGLALRGAGRHGEAAMAFEQAHGQAELPHRKEETLFLIGQSRYSNGQYNTALEHFDAYLAKYPDGTFADQARYQRANALAGKDDLSQAVIAFRKLSNESADLMIIEKAMLRIGELYLAAAQYKEAEDAFSEMLKRFPDRLLRMEGLHGRAMARYQQWKPEAQEDFTLVAEQATDQKLREHAQFMLAVRHFELGQDQEAITICENMLEESPDSVWAPEVRFRLAQFAFNAGRYSDAEVAFLSFADLYPDHNYVPQGLLRAGQAAIRGQQFVKGNEILGRMAQQFPDHPLLPLARFHQAEALMQLGRHTTAILTFQEVIRLAPNTELAYMSWGREGDCHFTLSAEDPSRLEQAAQAYQVVVQGGDVRLADKLQASCKLGMTYEKMERSAAALEQYHDGVIIPFHLAIKENQDVGQAERIWYSRAARNAMEILERQKDWRRLAGILDRVATSGTDLAADAMRRARMIRSEYWWLFY